MASRCNELQLSEARTAIIAISRPHYLILSGASKPHYLPLKPHYLIPDRNHRVQTTLCDNGVTRRLSEVFQVPGISLPEGLT